SRRTDARAAVRGGPSTALLRPQVLNEETSMAEQKDPGKRIKRIVKKVIGGGVEDAAEKVVKRVLADDDDDAKPRHHHHHYQATPQPSAPVNINVHVTCGCCPDGKHGGGGGPTGTPGRPDHHTGTSDGTG